MLRDALLVAGKDLRIERRSRVTTNQVAPFAVVVPGLFAFALDPGWGLLPVAAPVLLSATRAWEVALGTGGAGDGAGPWLRLLVIFAVVYVAFGVVAFGALLEEA